MFFLHSSWIWGPAAFSMDCDTAPWDSIKSLPVVLTSTSTCTHCSQLTLTTTTLSSCSPAFFSPVTAGWVGSVKRALEIHATGTRFYRSHALLVGQSKHWMECKALTPTCEITSWTFINHHSWGKVHRIPSLPDASDQFILTLSHHNRSYLRTYSTSKM